MSSLVRLIPPTGGVSRPSGSQAVANDKAQILKDFLVHHPGRLVMRGAFGNPTTLFAATQTPTGVWTFGEKFLVDAFVGVGGAQLFDSAATTVTSVTPVAGGLISGRSARLGVYAYGASSSASSRLIRWDGSTTAPAVMSAGPLGGHVVATHLERLFVAGGTNPDGTGLAKPNTLWWSDPGGPLANALTDWQDDVSGLVNQVAVGDDGDVIEALVPLSGQMLVFKRNSIWRLIGDRPSNFTVRRLASNIGCYSAATTLAVDDQCFFFASDGLPTLFNGDALVRLYGFPGITSLSNSLFGKAVRLTNDYVLVTNADPSSTSTTTWALLHLPTQAWSEVTLAGLLNGTSVYLGATAFGIPYVIDGKAARDLFGITAFGDGTEKNSAGASVAISPTVKYRLAELATPLTKAAVQRVIVDHTLHQSGGTGTGSWSVALADATAAAVCSASVASASSALLDRSVNEVFSEATDVCATVSYVAAAGVPALDAATLQDVWLEYEPAQRR